MIGPVESGLSIRAHLHAVQSGNPTIRQWGNLAIGQSCNYPIASRKRPHSASGQLISGMLPGWDPPSLGSLMTTAVITVTLRRNNAIIQIVFLEICLHHCSSSLREWAEKKPRLVKPKKITCVRRDGYSTFCNYLIIIEKSHIPLHIHLCKLFNMWIYLYFFKRILSA